MSSDQNPAYAVYIGDYMGLYNPVIYMVFIRSHYKDLCQSPGRMECRKDFNVAHMFEVYSLSWHNFAVNAHDLYDRARFLPH